MKQVLVLAILILICFHATFSCSLAVKSLSDFDNEEYIFIGEVIDYTNPIKSSRLNNEAVGLIVKVKDSINLPKTPEKYFEVFPIELWADCSLGGKSADELKKEFPINSEIRVIAKEVTILPKVSNKNIRLEDSPEEHGSIDLNFDNKTRRMSSVSNFFDYEPFTYIFSSDKEIFKSYYSLPYFEIRKDLLRLAKSTNQTEKNQILNRLLYVPIGIDFDIYRVFGIYSQNSTDYEHLYCKRLLEVEGLSQQEFDLLKDKLPKVCSQYKNKG